MPEHIQRERLAPIRVAVLQRVCTSYRAPLFHALTACNELVVRLFIGDDVPGSKVRNAENLAGLDVVRLPTRFLHFGRRVLVWHGGLMARLGAFGPDVVVSEGESNLLSYLQALIYRLRHREVVLVHWSLGGMPGEPMVRRGPRGWLVRFLRRRFDGYIVYSSYGKEVLVANGISAERIAVATNVSDLKRHLAAAASVNRDAARRLLGLDERFCVLFVGALTVHKRLDVLIEAMRRLDPSRFRCIIVGDGEVAGQLRETIATENLHHVYMAGRVTAGIENYYRGADAMVLPGRGGMVISEAMAYGLPVIAYHADGTEYDLIEQGRTGFRLERGDADEIRLCIETLAADPARARAMGERGQARVAASFTTEHMVDAITRAIVARVSAHQACRS